MFKNTHHSHTRHSYPFANLSLNAHFNQQTSHLESPFELSSSSFFSKSAKNHTQLTLDKISRETTDLKAFKQKYQIDDNQPPISCFRLISTPQPKLFISLKELNEVEFPMLSYTISELTNFSKMVIEATPERKAIGKSFNLNKLIQLIADNYYITAYHNFTHAFSLLLMLYQNYNRCPTLKGLLTEKQWFYVMIAALMHDLKHPGSTNAFEVKSKSAMAQEADNTSVLQKMHLNQFWNILKKNSQVNFLQGYSSKQSNNIKSIITRMVFSTDVANHFKNLNVLKTVNEAPVLDSKDSVFVVEQLFHACDIGNPCLDFNTYMNWASLVSFQFNEITKKQQNLGLQVTGFLKYENMKKFYNSQVGFCKGLVLPLWKQLHFALPGISTFTNNIEANMIELQRRAQAEHSS